MVQTWDWYEERLPGLGDRFLAAVEAAIAGACRWPGAGAPTIRDEQGEIVERMVTTHGFPHVVRYRIRDGQLIVMAVYHQRRNPAFATDRRP